MDNAKILVDIMIYLYHFIALIISKTTTVIVSPFGLQLSLKTKLQLYIYNEEYPPFS